MRAPQANLTLHGTTFVLWAGLAASVVFWGLRLSAPSVGQAAAVAPVGGSEVQLDTTSVSRLLGATPGTAGAAPPMASRFSLLGVVAGRSHEGAALIAIDGKPAKPFRVGASLEEGLVLQSVEARRALLGPAVGGPAIVTLELPAPKRAEARGPAIAVQQGFTPGVVPDGSTPVRTKMPIDGRNDAVGVRTQGD